MVAESATLNGLMPHQSTTPVYAHLLMTLRLDPQRPMLTPKERSQPSTRSVLTTSLFIGTAQTSFRTAHWFDERCRQIVAVSATGDIFLTADDRLMRLTRLGQLRPGFSSVAWSQTRRALAALSASGLSVVHFGSESSGSQASIEAVSHAAFPESEIVAITQEDKSGRIAGATNSGEILLSHGTYSQLISLHRTGRRISCLAWSPGGE